MNQLVEAVREEFFLRRIFKKQGDFGNSDYLAVLVKKGEGSIHYEIENPNKDYNQLEISKICLFPRDGERKENRAIFDYTMKKNEKIAKRLGRKIIEINSKGFDVWLRELGYNLSEGKGIKELK